MKTKRKTTDRGMRTAARYGDSENRYEFIYTGRHVTDGYHYYKTKVISAHSLIAAELKLKADFVTIKIHDQGLAY